MYKASAHRGMNRRDVACRVRCDVSDWNQQNMLTRYASILLKSPLSPLHNPSLSMLPVLRFVGMNGRNNDCLL